MPKIRKRFLESKEIRKNQREEETKVSFSITIDKEIADAMKLQDGDVFHWIVEEKRKGKRKLILQEI